MVSIPVGFSSPLQLKGLNTYGAKVTSFNPCRVFKSAATLEEAHGHLNYFRSFNPCRVFKSAATQPDFCICGMESLGFNPCRVFKSAATEQEFDLETGQISFNPCRVFKSAATLRAQAITAITKEVSIPVGFSSPLQPSMSVVLRIRRSIVSIPVGFSSPLQLNELLAKIIAYNLFQSLSGFQVRCNQRGAGIHQGHQAVSIPVGFSSPLQRYYSRSICSKRCVSIPVGFSSPLQH